MLVAVSSFAPKTPSSLSLEVDTAKAKQRLQSANKKQHTTTTGKTPLTRTQRALKRFIIERVLGDPELLAKYTKGKVRTNSHTFSSLRCPH